MQNIAKMSVLKTANAYVTLASMVVYLLAPMAMVLVPATTYATAGYSISGSYTISGFVVSLLGTATGNPYTGQSDAQTMGVDWTGACASASATEFAFDTITFVGGTGPSQNNGTFTNATWSTSHDFLSAGTYPICVKVYHANFNGAEGSDAATFSATIIVPIPTPTPTPTATPTPTPTPTATPTPTPTATPTPEPTSTGGGGGGGWFPTSFPPASPAGQVLGASTELPNGCTAYLGDYIKLGRKNNSEEVKKLQIFLNSLGEKLPVTGFYGPLSFGAVKRFQVAAAAEILNPWLSATGNVDTSGTGYVYKTTKRWINMLNCPSLNLPMPTLP